jgi:L-lactate dehydrogenase complex protein LldG
VADVDLAIVRASFAVDEIGSVLSDADLHVNAIAYLAQHLIVLLDPADIVVICTMPTAGPHCGRAGFWH